MLNLSDLPPDIYTIILSHVTPLDRQQAVLNLSRALPRSPVPTHQLYDHIIVHTPPAVIALYHIFRKRKQKEKDLYNPSSQVQSFSIRTWVADADLVANLLELLPNVPVVQLCIGTTYGPEHLNDMFAKPRLDLRSLQLRFRPYVKQATYLPFLKGAYFDSTIDQLTKWPATPQNHIENLSITQDTISYKAHVKFAQPLAFFSFKVLTDLATSPIGHNLTALRISVPAKPVAPYLSVNQDSFPRLDFLDMSTTSLPPPTAEQAIGKLLSQLSSLRHIVIDRNAGPMPRDTPGWTSFGRACALAGVGKAKAKEKEIQEWFEAKRRQEIATQATNPEQAAAAERTIRPNPTPRARKGRKGLATATISLRDPPRASTSTSTSTRPIAIQEDTPSDIRKIRIVPSPPTLRTFSTAFAGPTNPTAQQRTDWTNAFTSGFIDGCRTLNMIWKRMQDSASVRIMRFTNTDLDAEVEEEEEVLKGVADVALVGHWIGWEPTIPIVCFGTERSIGDRLGRMTLEFDVDGNSGGATDPAPAALTETTAAGPNSVGGLWEEEEFIPWGPGHVDGCGHHIGRDIFERQNGDRGA